MLEAVVLSFLCILERLEKRIYFFIFWKQKEINKKGEINYKIRIKGEEALTEDGERERERARERGRELVSESERTTEQQGTVAFH